MKTIWVVRVVDPELKMYEAGEQFTSTQREMRCRFLTEFLEQLRYAHLAHPFRGGYDLMPPKSITDTKMWSTMNAERMRSFGYNAVSAPSLPLPRDD